MRIAIVCSYYPWPPSIGGFETIVQNVSGELAKRGHKVHVITTPFDVTTMRQVSEYGVENRDGVVIHKLKSTFLRIGYARLLKGLKDTLVTINPDIVHAHHLHPHLFQLSIWKSELKYRLVSELHHPVVSLEKLTAKVMFPFAFSYLKWKSKSIDCFIAHTNLERQWLEKKGIAKDKISIIRFPAIPSKLLNYSYSSSSSKDASVLYLGRITWVKGLHILIKAFAQVKKLYPEMKLKLAGPSDEHYEKYLRKLSLKHGLLDSVDFIGPIYGEEKINLISLSTILILPSLKEYTGGVLLEAQALGVPVIATRVGAVPEMMIDGKTGLLVKPNDELELAKAIELLIGNHELRRRFSLNAKEFAKAFTVEHRVDELEALYGKVLSYE